MSKLPIVVTVLVVIQLALQSNAVEYLSSDGYSTAVILLFSSIVMLAVSTIMCVQKQLSPLPKNWSMQWIRMLCSGLGLYLSTLSYHYLHATTASLIFELMVPFIVILGAIESRQSDVRLFLSVGIIGLSVLFFCFTPYSQEPTIGVLTAFLAVTILAVGYRLTKESVVTENQYVIINVTCLSCMLVSLICLAFTDHLNWHYSYIDFGLLIGVGLLRYGQYLCLILLLQVYSTDRAQFPFLLGALTTMFLEMWIEHRFFSIPYMVAVVVLIILVGAIVAIPTSNPIATAEKALT
jgi:hypothetical protein